MTESSKLEEMHALANSVRRVYNRLRHSTDQLHAETGISAPKRTLLMDLQRYGPQTVPALAAARFISRQIIQTQVNELTELGYTEARDNPEHKRSSLIALTARGGKLVREMTERENAFIQQIGWLPDAQELQICRQVLDAIDDKLEAQG